MSASPSPRPETANINGYLKAWRTGGSRQKAFTSLAPDNLLYIMSFLLPDDILSLRLVSNISSRIRSTSSLKFGVIPVLQVSIQYQS
jgi:hypothetical protein